MLNYFFRSLESQFIHNSLIQSIQFEANLNHNLLKIWSANLTTEKRFKPGAESLNDSLKGVKHPANSGNLQWL